MPTPSGTATLSGTTNQSSPYAYSHTVPATGARRALVVQVSAFDAGGGAVTGVTYNGVSMTKVGSTYGALGGSIGIIETYVLVNPATGANNVSIAFSAGPWTELVSVAHAWTDVNQTTPTSSSDGGSGVSASPSLSLTVTGSDVGIAGVYFYSGGVDNATESDTLLVERASSAADSGFNGQHGDGSLSWSIAGAPSYAMMGVVLAHDAGAVPPGGPVLRGRVLSPGRIFGGSTLMRQSLAWRRHAFAREALIRRALRDTLRRAS